MTLTTLILLIAATWRVSSLLANESGPFGVFEKFRAWCEYMCENNRFCSAFRLYEGVTCEWCNSVWVGLLVTALSAPFLHLSVPELLGLPLALSTGAILVKYLIHNLELSQSRLEVAKASEDRRPKRRYIS
jgi:hypothetical protein